MSVNIVAPADVPAIVFDPPRSTLNVRLVSTQEQRWVYLENVSDSDLMYFLQYQTEFTLETGEINVQSELSEILELQKPRNKPDPKFIHSLFCDLPSGILPARSRTKLTMTFFPLRAGLYEFMIYAKVRAMDHKGSIVSISNDEAALMRITQPEREREDAERNDDGEMFQPQSPSPSPSAFTLAVQAEMRENPFPSYANSSPTFSATDSPSGRFGADEGTRKQYAFENGGEGEGDEFVHGYKKSTFQPEWSTMTMKDLEGLQRIQYSTRNSHLI
jgi:hypothetical protein